MKITFQQAALLRELQLLSSVVDRKATIPILAGVKLTALSTGELSCLATNLETALHSRTSATVSASGSVVAPLDVLTGLLQRFPPGECAFEMVNGLRAILSVNGSSAKIAMFAVEDFPQVPVTAGSAARVPASVLIELIARTRHAMGETSYYPAGAYCSIGDGRIRLAATDSYRIAVASSPLTSPGEAAAFGLSDRAWDAIAKMLHDETDDAPIAIAANEDRASVSTGLRTFTARVFDKKFPSYERLIPKEFAVTLAMDAEPVRAILRRHLVLTTLESSKVKWAFSQGSLVLTSDTVKGSCEDAVPATSTLATAAPFWLNPRYALDTVEALKAERIEVSLSKDGRTTIWHPLTAPDRMTAMISVMKG